VFKSPLLTLTSRKTMTPSERWKITFVLEPTMDWAKWPSTRPKLLKEIKKKILFGMRPFQFQWSHHPAQSLNSQCSIRTTQATMFVELDYSNLRNVECLTLEQPRNTISAFSPKKKRKSPAVFTSPPDSHDQFIP